MTRSLKTAIFSLLLYGGKKLLDRVLKGPVPEAKPAPGTPAPKEEKVHPWRICPIGEHWVKPHHLQVPVSPKSPEGVTIRNTGCRKNPVRSKKAVIRDYLHPDEIHVVAEEYFKALTGPPAAGRLPYPDSDRYDVYIRGWTKYWNEVFRPSDTLDPDLVKALIGSESSFKLDPKPPNAGVAGKARGLVQLTDQTIHILGDPQGELKDHLIKISRKQASDANIALCAGIRWLFYKKERASRRLGRQATWMEAIAEYKGYLKDIVSGKNPNPNGMKTIKDDLQELKK